MKKICFIMIPLLLCLLLCACKTRTEPEETGGHTTEPASTASAASAAETEPPQDPQQPQLPQADSGLFATWVNAGQYSGGRDYVETLTIGSDGTIRVHLDYLGKPYSDLTGSFIKQGSTLTFTMSDGTVRVYRYEVDANILTLASDDRTVTYRRSD